MSVALRLHSKIFLELHFSLCSPDLEFCVLPKARDDFVTILLDDDSTDEHSERK